MPELKSFVVKLVDVQTREIHYFEGEAESTEDAIHEITGYLPPDEFEIQTVFEEVIHNYMGVLHS